MMWFANPEPYTTLYDPACGSGGLLIKPRLLFEQTHPDQKSQAPQIYAQELAPTTYAMAKMNAFYTVLREVVEDVTSEQARAVDQVFVAFPDYQWDDHQQSQLRMMLYKTLRPTVSAKVLIETTNKLLRLERV